MRYRRINRQRSIALAGLLGMGMCGIGVCAGASAQVPTLEEILTRLQKNLDRYDSTVPSFFCDEEVDASARRGHPSPGYVPMTVGGTATDSTFFLQRISRPNDPMTLKESREVKKVNGKLAPANSIGGGKLYDGAFTDGLALVSLSQQACMQYSLEPIDPRYYPGDPILVEFTSVPAGQRAPACRIQEDVSGSVQVDPETMQVTRLQLHAPHHLVGTGTGYWDVTVEYAPVELAGERFWLPRKISETMADRSMSWFSVARYRHYHRMEATSRILPSDEVAAP